MKDLTLKRKAGLIIALLILIAMFIVPTPSGLTTAGMRALGCTLSMLVCLSTGALPLGLTSLIFMMFYYLLGATDSISTALSGMSAPPVLFILASFGMSAAVSESPISKRIMHFMLSVFGKSTKIMILGIMLATAIISAFISNVPVTAMFITIGLSFLDLYKDEEARKKTGKSLMIAIPVAAMIGGIMTPVGSSPNLVAISTLQEMTGYEITFIQWVVYGVPIAIVLLPLAWLLITKIFPPVELEDDLFQEFVSATKVDAKVNSQELKVIIIMGAMIVLWFMSSWVSGINLYVVGVLGVAAMFIPGINVLNWDSFMKSANWNVVLVTASVISLGSVISESGLSTWFVDAVFPADMDLPTMAVVFITAIFVIVMLLIIPISGALIQVLASPLILVAGNCGIAPVILIITLCFCATNCYLLPIDTVPLLAHGTGYFQMTDMPKVTVFILLALAVLCSLWVPIACGLIG